jgi:hypothetical protein
MLLVAGYLLLVNLRILVFDGKLDKLHKNI